MSYFEHLFKRSPSQSVVTAADKQKSFYEDVVQIGDKDNTGVGSADAEIATACLTEYVQGFQERNPNFYVFNAVMHLDEATPHLHIDYIPVGHYTNGVDTRNGIAQALKEMGYGTGRDAIARWREAECKLLTEICNRHGIQIAAPERSRGSLTVEKYKEYAQIKEQVDEKKQENALEERRAEEIEQRIETVQKQAEHIDNIIEIVQSAEVITVFKKPTGYVKMPEAEFMKLKNAAKGFDEDRTEKKSLQGVIDRLNDEIKKKTAQISNMARRMVENAKQLKLFKRAFKMSESTTYDDVLRVLTERGFFQKAPQKSQEHKKI